MRELRPQYSEREFVARVEAAGGYGYRLVRLSVDGETAAVAGVRIGESLSWGRYLYVDDLVTRSDLRSRGHGAALLRWIRAYARREGCAQLHLDSGNQRRDAHRFYEREGIAGVGVHFAEMLNP